MSLDTAEPISNELNPVGESTQPVLDDEILERLERLGATVGEDLLSQLIVLFLADADAHVIDLRRAVAANTGADVVRLAHSLSGASANLGASNLALLCTGLETAGSVGDLVTGALLLAAMETELAQVRGALVLRLPTT